MDEVVVLINFNDYLGGGETLMVRFSDYLNRNKVNFISFCLSESFINKELEKKNVVSKVAIVSDVNFFYLNELNRKELIDILKANVNGYKTIRFVTFCMRDLHIAYALSKDLKSCSITHLILHAQDDLYVGQTLLDKFIYNFFHKRKFSNKSKIIFNRRLLHIINANNGLILMAEVIGKLWKQNFALNIPRVNLVPLPSFVENNKIFEIDCNVKKIIWVGRIVDFKVPALLSMINFVSDNKHYSLTVVGTGDKSKIETFIVKNALDVSRVVFEGEVPYDKLGDIISRHSIGYGMGTSLVELAKYRIPVIIALANYDHTLFDKQICGGLFFDKPMGCDGSDLLFSKANEVVDLLPSVIAQIEDDYSNVANACYEYAKLNYSQDNNFRRYYDIIKKSKEMQCKDKEFEIPSASLIRKFFFKKIRL